MNVCIGDAQNKRYKLFGICITILLANGMSIPGLAIDDNYINQTIFDDTIGSATLYTKDLGNLSRGETFYINVQSYSVDPWELTIYKTAPNGNRFIWISNQCIIPPNVIETKVIDAGSYQLELKPKSVGAEANLGVIAVNSDKLSRSIEWHILAIKNTKASTIADELRKKADALRSLGKYDEAIQEYDKAIEINPHDYEARIKQKLAFGDLDNYDEIIKAYDEAIRQDPNDAAAWTKKGWALNHQSKYDEAIKCYDEALRLDPNNAAVWTRKGAALDDLGRYDEAIKYHDEALGLDPGYAIAWNNKGNALYAQGRYDEAINCFDEALRLGLEYTGTWNNKGVALGHLGKHDEAIKCYDEALRLDPGYAISWNNKGINLEALGGRTSEANAAFAKAKELGYTG
jgi:tetratricopeptide (TPR) repeat protein